MKIEYKIKSQYLEDYTYCDKAIELMDKIQKAGKAPYLYSPPNEFFLRTCKEGMLVIHAFDGDRLVGYRVVRFLSKWPGFLGPISGLDPKETALYLFTIVDDEYRGLGIGKMMNKVAYEEVIKTNTKNLISTIHPDNIANITNAKSMGFEELEKRELFEEKLIRSIMIKKI